ncbi:MAG: outer membrane beta-barrel protein [Chitinophagaceae bacterium]|nr:outer membrane beta-barrel protein [Chitinophagaceae bacterium]MBK8951183.1 outer membrane beta-barrel protein [Chitinophagaceae bacterium]
MENRMNNRDFEQFVKQNADQYRMFPSEKVWEGIHDRLHNNRRRWFGAGLALLLLTISSVTWIMFTNTDSKKVTITSANFESYTQPSGKSETQEIIITPIKRNVNSHDNNQPATVRDQQKNLFLAISSVQPTAPSELIYEETSMVTTEKVNTRELNEQSENISTRQNIPASSLLAKTSTLSVKQPTVSISQTTQEVKPDNKTNNNITPEEDILVSEKKQSETTVEVMSIESVTNSYVRLKKPKKMSWQVYFSPLVTYRALKENKGFIEASRNLTNTTGNQFVYYPADLDNIIFHKPDIGFNLGVSAGYPILRNLKIISGLQFNVNKYDIRAYQYSNEVAAVALSNDAGGTNTIYPITSYRIVGGFKAKWLRNFYFSVSAPIGAEYAFVNKKRTSFGITGTVQPSFILENKSYLVSTDYKNYVELPSLTRRWNINTGLELFAGIKSGKTEWRIGPQVRYQTLSSYKETYPVKEHLFDFGLKLGVMLK